MQWLRRIVPKLLVLGAVVAVILAVAGDPYGEYGSVPLPQGGVVDLPEGKVQVFVDEPDSSSAPGLSSALAFTITPVGGSGALPIDPATDEGSAEQLVQRAESVGSGNPVASLQVPSAGDYRVSGAFEQASTAATLKFGTSVFGAVLKDWKLWGGLLLAAALFSLLPVPKPRLGDDSVSDGSGGYQPRRSVPYNG